MRLWRWRRAAPSWAGAKLVLGALRRGAEGRGHGEAAWAKRFYIVGEGVYGEREEGDVDGKLLVRAAAADAAGGRPGRGFASRASRRPGTSLSSSDRRPEEPRRGDDRRRRRAVDDSLGFTYFGQFIDHDLTSTRRDATWPGRITGDDARGRLAGARPRLLVWRWSERLTFGACTTSPSPARRTLSSRPSSSTTRGESTQSSPTRSPNYRSRRSDHPGPDHQPAAQSRLA